MKSWVLRFLVFVLAMASSAFAGANRTKCPDYQYYDPVSEMCVPRFNGTTEQLLTSEARASVRERVESLRNRNENAARAAAQSPGALATAAPSYRQAFAITGNGTVLAPGSGTDSAGNVYLAGGFTGSVTFPTSPSTTLTASGDMDFFLAKFSSAGQCLWVRVGRSATGLLPGMAQSGALSLVVDTSGGTYVGGAFVRALSFRRADNTVAATVSGSGPGYNAEAFLARYDTNGNLQWAVGGGSGAPQDANSLGIGANAVTNLTLDSSGNLFAGGNFNGSALLGYSLGYSTVDAAFVAKINPSTGTPVWVQATNSDGFDGIQDIAPDQSGGVYALLWSNGTQMSFNTSPSATVISFEADEVDSFVARFNSTGTCLWARQPGSGPSGVFLLAMGLSVSPQGEPYVTGQASGDATFDGLALASLTYSNVETFLTRYSPSGPAQWVRSLRSTNFSYASRVLVDDSGFAYIWGGYAGTTSMNGNLSTGGLSITSVSDEDLYIAQYDYLGTPRWIRSVPTSSAANEGFAVPNTEFFVDPVRMAYNAMTRNVLLTGNFVGTLALESNLILQGSGSQLGTYAATLPGGDSTAATGDPALRITLPTRGWSNATANSTYYVDIALTNAGTGPANSASLTGVTVTGVSGAAVTGTTFPVSLGDIPPTGTRTQRILISGLPRNTSSRIVLSVNGRSIRASDSRVFTAALSTAINVRTTD